MKDAMGDGAEIGLSPLFCTHRRSALGDHRHPGAIWPSENGVGGSAEEVEEHQLLESGSAALSGPVQDV